MTNRGRPEARGSREPAIMQRDTKRSRMTAVGRSTDDGEQCTVLAVCETGGTWAMYPHSWSTFEVRLPRAEAVNVVGAILAGDAGER